MSVFLQYSSKIENIFDSVAIKMRIRILFEIEEVSTPLKNIKKEIDTVFAHPFNRAGHICKITTFQQIGFKDSTSEISW